MGDPKGIVPDLGKDAGDFSLDVVKQVLRTKGDVPTAGVGGGPADRSGLTDELDTVEEGLGHWGTLGTVVGALGLAATGIVAGLNDYGAHHSYGRGIAVGLLHAGLTAFGAWLGEGLGGAAGSLIAPGPGTVVGAFIGGSGGAYAGDWAAGQIVNHIDDGSIGNAVGGAASAVGNVVQGGASAVGNAWNSLFG